MLDLQATASASAMTVSTGSEKDHRRTILLTGRVLNGRGNASAHIAKCMPELSAITGGPLFPGSLNVILDRPTRFHAAAAARFDGGNRFLWPAKLDGVHVWIYRWQHAALHVVEILAAVRLKDAFGLADGDPVKLQVSDSLVRPVPVLSRAVWAACWLGRKKWCYTHDRYYRRTLNTCRRLGATQLLPTEEVSRVMIDTVKKAIGRTPVVGPMVKRLFGRPLRSADFVFSRTATNNLVGSELALRQIRNLLTYTKTSNASYNAEEYPAGYHTLELHGERLVGQREPAARIALVPTDFTGKSVLDIGSNQGGMLLAVREKVKWGVGVDYDPHMVNVANRLRSLTSAPNLNFFVFDLQKEPLELILDFMPDEQADICFLLSVCMWLSNWRSVIDFAHRASRTMLFESNGSDQQQDEQIAYLRSRYRSVAHLSAESADDPKQRRRKLYFLTDPVR